MIVQHSHWFDVVSADCLACRNEVDAPELRHECEICGRPSAGVWCRFHESVDDDRADIVYGARGSTS